MVKVLTIGAGSWGTALSVLLANKSYKCYLWEYNEKYREMLKKDRMNKTFLDGVKFPDTLEVIDDFNEKALDVDIILIATPTQFIRKTIKNMIKLKKGQIIVNVSKGIEEHSLKRISEILEEELKEKDFNYVHFAGPTHAEEIVKKNPSAILSVSKNDEVAKKVQQIFSTSFLRVYTGNDVIGSELAGSLKNCIAIVAGICDGLNYGDNAKAAIMTRGLGEMMVIAKHYNAKEKTLMGLTGLGDLIVTCTSKHSRNRSLGERIGKGEKLEDIVASMTMVCEGVTTIKALKEIIKINKLRTPIFDELYEILYKNKDVTTIADILINRDLRAEF